MFQNKAHIGSSGSGMVGFDRGLKPEKVLGATDASGKLYYLLKWEGSNRCDLVHHEECHEKCPKLILKFLEDKLTWKASEPIHEG